MLNFALKLCACLGRSGRWGEVSPAAPSRLSVDIAASFMQPMGGSHLFGQIAAKWGYS